MRTSLRRTEQAPQSGQAMVETVVILTATLLLLFGIIQFGLIYHAKVALDYAVFEAAREGAVNHAARSAIEYGLARGLAPLYTSISSADSGLDKVRKVQTARDRILSEIRSGQFSCIERLNPTREAFNAYGVSGQVGTVYDGPMIPNDNLRYRSATPRSGANVSIQDANLLKLRVTYCYPLYVPLISSVIKRLEGVEPDPDPPPGWVTPHPGDFQAACYRANRIPLVAQAVVRMQSAAIDDNFPAHCD